MKARERDDRLDSRAAAIIAESRILAAIEPVIRRCAASTHNARSWLLVRRVARELGALPQAERRVITLLIVAVGLGGHWVMAWMLPLPASPTRALTAVALVAASLAAVAASARST